MIGRALMHNSAAVISLHETQLTLEDTRMHYQQCQRNEAALTTENKDLLRILDNLKYQLQQCEGNFASTESELRNELDSAVELIEKQNALTITLEAKVTFFWLANKICHIYLLSVSNTQIHNTLVLIS